MSNFCFGHTYYTNIATHYCFLSTLVTDKKKLVNWVQIPEIIVPKQTYRHVVKHGEVCWRTLSPGIIAIEQAAIWCPVARPFAYIRSAWANNTLRSHAYWVFQLIPSFRNDPMLESNTIIVTSDFLTFIYSLMFLYGF